MFLILLRLELSSSLFPDLEAQRVRQMMYLKAELFEQGGSHANFGENSTDDEGTTGTSR
jgi:hypothetical protein